MCKHHMELYYIKHQETANHSKHSFANTMGCTQDTNTQHPYDETKVFPMDIHLKLHGTQLKQLTQTQTHPLHDLNAHIESPKNIKATIFHNNEHIDIIISELGITPEECRENFKHIHTTITSQYLSSRKNNKVTNTTPYDIHQNKHYHVICVRNWHSSVPTNHHSFKVTYIHEP